MTIRTPTARPMPRIIHTVSRSACAGQPPSGSSRKSACVVRMAARGCDGPRAAEGPVSGGFQSPPPPAPPSPPPGGGFGSGPRHRRFATPVLVLVVVLVLLGRGRTRSGARPVERTPPRALAPEVRRARVVLARDAVAPTSPPQPVGHVRLPRVPAELRLDRVDPPAAAATRYSRPSRSIALRAPGCVPRMNHSLTVSRVHDRVGHRTRRRSSPR